MNCSQSEKSVTKIDNAFFEFGVPLEDNDKTINFLQVGGLIPNDTRIDCKFYGMQRSVALHKKSKQIIPYILTCSQWRRVSGASNMVFKVHTPCSKTEFGIDIFMAS